MDEFLKKILHKYNIEPTKIYPEQKGYRNRSFLIKDSQDNQFNLIIYKKEFGILKKIHAANNLSAILANENLPVRKPVNKILKLRDNYYACLYNYLPGKTIPWEAYTKDHLKLLGEYMNKLHFESSRSTPHNYANEADNLKSIIQRLQLYFANKDVIKAMDNKLKLEPNFQKFLQKTSVVLDFIDKNNQQCILHMDFVRGNVLFEDNPLRISGILDFEKASFGSPLFDLARTLAFLIVDCKYKSEEQIRKYFLKSGYIKRGKYKLEGYRYLNKLVALYLVYDFYKFLKHNPYEFLQQNEHFIRTKDILINTKLLRTKL